MGLHLFFLPNFPGAMFIQGATFIPDSRVYSWSIEPLSLLHSKLKFEWVTLESMICRSVTKLNLVTYIYLFWETDYNQPFQIN